MWRWHLCYVFRFALWDSESLELVLLLPYLATFQSHVPLRKPKGNVDLVHKFSVVSEELSIPKKAPNHHFFQVQLMACVVTVCGPLMVRIQFIFVLLPPPPPL